jgi:hypothetical protein
MSVVPPFSALWLKMTATITNKKNTAKINTGIVTSLVFLCLAISTCSDLRFVTVGLANSSPDSTYVNPALPAHFVRGNDNVPSLGATFHHPPVPHFGGLDWPIVSKQ